MSVIEKAFKNAYKDMDPITGEFPADWCCISCGKQLNADGGHPAEIYAGTYNGLCYPCTSKPFYVESTDPLDGALKLSYPPHCPSWRRDREHFTAYADCDSCHATGIGPNGRNMVGDWYRTQCKPCSDRKWNHPLRKWEHLTWLAKAAQARFDRLLDQEAIKVGGLKKRPSKKALTEARVALIENDPEKVKEFQEAVLTVYYRLKTQHEALREQRIALAAEAFKLTQPEPVELPDFVLLWWDKNDPLQQERNFATHTVVARGSEDEMKVEWANLISSHRGYGQMLNPVRYQTIGALANNATHALHLIGAGTAHICTKEAI